MGNIKVTDKLPNLKAKRQIVSQLTEKESLRNKRSDKLPNTLLTDKNAKWSIAGYSLRPKVW